MKPLNKATSKYQTRYSALTTSGQQRLSDFFASRKYHQAVVIPAFNETPDFIARFAKLPCAAKTLLLVVANCPNYAAPQAKQQTQAFINDITDKYQKENVMEGVTFGQLNSRQDLLLLDITNTATPTTLPPTWLTSLQSGVGFARKTGMDVALTLICRGSITSPWIYNSDADADWPMDYLTLNKQAFTTKGALVFPFCHQAEQPGQSLATAAALYDISLRYYVLGLRWAESPWAYHTIGSTLLIHSDSYIETHGFPIREAGEDFYLLNKIAKTGCIYCPAEPCINLSDRGSDRVPFGTGPAVTKINQHSDPESEFTLYHPEIFTLLKVWHQTITTLFSQKDLSGLPSLLKDGLNHLGIDKALAHCQQQAKNPTQFAQQLWQWFDGFRTLKLVHWLRANHYPSVSFKEWQQRLNQGQIPFIAKPSESHLHPVELNHHIQQQENKTLPFTGGLQS